MTFTFACHLGHVVFSDLHGQNAKTSEILSDTCLRVWLVNIVSIEHGQ